MGKMADNGFSLPLIVQMLQLSGIEIALQHDNGLHVYKSHQHPFHLQTWQVFVLTTIDQTMPS